MAEATVEGRVRGRAVAVHWDDGAVTGDREVIERARELVAQRVSVRGPPVPTSYEAALDEPRAFIATVAHALDQIGEFTAYSVEGVAPLPSTPPGAEN
jgi:hypothetical protein